MGRKQNKKRGAFHPKLLPEQITTQVTNTVDYTRRSWAIIKGAVNVFVDIDGSQHAGAFAYFAFASLFPLVILLITFITPFFRGQDMTEGVISYLQMYVPLTPEMQQGIFSNITGVIEGRAPAGIVAVLLLIWTAVQGFTALMTAVNQTWKQKTHKWYQLPLKGVVAIFLSIGVVLTAVAVPVIFRLLKDLILPQQSLAFLNSEFVKQLLSLFLVFCCLAWFYKWAPTHGVRWRDVWLGAVVATVLLRGAEVVFVIYLTDFATLNAVYGAFGGIMALLLWIYLSGNIFILGSCICAASVQKSEETIADH